MHPETRNQEFGAVVRNGSSLRKRFLLGAVFGFIGMWLLAAADLVDGYPRSRETVLVEAFFASLIAAFVVGALAIPAPMLLNQLITVLLPKILGSSVEQPLVRAVQHPLMRLLALVFIGVWLVKFGSLKEGFLSVTWSAALAVLMVLGAVVLWRLATRDKP